MNPTEFLNEIYGREIEIKDGVPGYINIFTSNPNNEKDVKVKWFSDMAKAGEYAAKQKGKNVYFSLGIYPQQKSSNKKGTAKEAIGYQALCVDVDIKGSSHAKENLAESEEHALELIDAAFPGDWAPSLITNTGGGVQAFWILKEPWIFEDDDEADEGRALFEQTVRWLQSRADPIAVDPTITLSQIMRIPGTHNVKQAEPRLVKVIRNTEGRFLPDHMMDLVGTMPVKKTSDADKTYQGIVLKEDANPPANKLAALLENETKFRAAWNKRLDQEKMQSGGDASLSSYDMTLVNFATQWHWTEQEKANLIIAFRRTHQQKPQDFRKALRWTYIEKTLKAAKSFTPSDTLDQESRAFYGQCIAKQASRNGSKKSKKDEEKEAESMRKQAKAEFLKNLGVPLKKINKYNSTPPEYELVMEDGQQVMVGSSASLLSQEKMRQVMFDSFNVHLVTKKQRDWQAITSSFRYLINFIETSDETREYDALASWVLEYVDNIGINKDPGEASQQGEAFKENGRIMIFAGEFRKFLTLQKDEKYSSKDIGVKMERFGEQPRKPKHFEQPSGKRTTKACYDVTEIINNQKRKKKYEPSKAEAEEASGS